jgi:hypothetical protein
VIDEVEDGDIEETWRYRSIVEVDCVESISGTARPRTPASQSHDVPVGTSKHASRGSVVEDCERYATKRPCSWKCDAGGII